MADSGRGEGFGAGPQGESRAVCGGPGSTRLVSIGGVGEGQQRVGQRGHHTEEDIAAEEAENILLTLPRLSRDGCRMCYALL